MQYCNMTRSFSMYSNNFLNINEIKSQDSIVNQATRAANVAALPATQFNHLIYLNVARLLMFAVIITFLLAKMFSNSCS
ncbi:hypothetical protein Avbf_18156 [Armadillidium vulgare]|nr:hypothetical protein Avbf_18156 [Armadillidium vulgare]